MKILKLLVLFIITAFIFNSCTSEVETIEDEMENTQENNPTLFGRGNLKYYIVTFPSNSTSQERMNFRNSIIDFSSGESGFIGDTVLTEHWYIYDVIDLNYQPLSSFGPQCVKCVTIVRGLGDGEPEKGENKLIIDINQQIPIL